MWLGEKPVNAEAPSNVCAPVPAEKMRATLRVSSASTA